MATTFRIKRFSDDDKKDSGMGLGTKLALGTAAVGGGLLAGKAGWLGSGVQRATGSMIGNIGKSAGWNSWVKEGSKTIGKAEGRSVYKKGISDGLTESQARRQAAVAQGNARRDAMKEFKIENKPVTNSGGSTSSTSQSSSTASQTTTQQTPAQTQQTTPTTQTQPTTSSKPSSGQTITFKQKDPAPGTLNSVFKNYL